MRNYIKVRGDYQNDDQQFFIFKDRTPVMATHARSLLKETLFNLGLNLAYYGMHSFRIGRTTDLIKYNYSIEQVKIMGRWRSNVIFKYIR